MEYRPVELYKEFSVERMVTVHYFQFARGYVFTGEKHEFWELVYMDKGAAEIGADGRRFFLNEGEAVFHKPGEFHSIWAGGNKAPDIIVISFVCTSSAMIRFAGVQTAVDGECKRLIAQIITEAQHAWTNKLGSNYLELVRRQGSPAGSEQMVMISLEALLIRLARTRTDAAVSQKADIGDALRPRLSSGRNEYLQGLAREIENYAAEHLDDKITIGILCRRFNMSGTSIKLLFHHRHGCGVMEYVSRTRHEAAKRYIREGLLNMSAIAEKCGYGSVHYFSRRFTHMEGMTPSEYSRSVKSMAGIQPDL